MSLNRRSRSRQHLNTKEDMLHCLEQKNHLIASLRTEVDSMRMNQNKYFRAQESLNLAKENYEKLNDKYVQFLSFRLQLIKITLIGKRFNTQNQRN